MNLEKEIVSLMQIAPNLTEEQLRCLNAIANFSLAGNTGLKALKILEEFYNARDSQKQEIGQKKVS